MDLFTTLVIILGLLCVFWMIDTSEITEIARAMSGHEIPNSGHFDEEREALSNLFPKHTHKIKLHLDKIFVVGQFVELRPLVFETSNGWHIEGNFLIINVWDDEAQVYRKQAHRIPSEVVAITEERIYPLGAK